MHPLVNAAQKHRLVLRDVRPVRFAVVADVEPFLAFVRPVVPKGSIAMLAQATFVRKSRANLPTRVPRLVFETETTQ